MDEYEQIIEEGVTLSPYTREFTAWLQYCLGLLEAGDEDHIMSDPWYKRGGDRDPLTDEQIDTVIEAIDKEYDYELNTYAVYHRNRSGANTSPEFSRMSPRARRAMVEQLDRIVRKYQV